MKYEEEFDSVRLIGSRMLSGERSTQRTRLGRVSRHCALWSLEWRDFVVYDELLFLFFLCGLCAILVIIVVLL